MIFWVFFFVKHSSRTMFVIRKKTLIIEQSQTCRPQLHVSLCSLSLIIAQHSLCMLSKKKSDFQVMCMFYKLIQSKYGPYRSADRTGQYFIQIVMFQVPIQLIDVNANKSFTESHYLFSYQSRSNNLTSLKNVIFTQIVFSRLFTNHKTFRFQLDIFTMTHHKVYSIYCVNIPPESVFIHFVLPAGFDISSKSCPNNSIFH